MEFRKIEENKINVWKHLHYCAICHVWAANVKQIYLNKIKGENRVFTFSLYLQNMGLRQELDRLKNENMLLRDKLSKYTDV